MSCGTALAACCTIQTNVIPVLNVKNAAFVSSSDRLEYSGAYRTARDNLGSPSATFTVACNLCALVDDDECIGVIRSRRATGASALSPPLLRHFLRGCAGGS